MNKEKLPDDLLNDGLQLSMEFGENWLTDIGDRLKSKYPQLTVDLKKCEFLCRKINKHAHDFLRENPVRNKNEIGFIDFPEFHSLIKAKYSWIDDTNLRKLYSQSCYYALK